MSSRMKRPVAYVTQGEQYPLFTTIALEISAQCNRVCVFCPNSTHVRPDEHMPDELIDKALYELGALKYAGTWQPHMYNEPLSDPRLPTIVRRVRQLVPRAVISLNTNCDFLTPRLLDELIDAGVNSMACNIYSARDGSANAATVARGVVLSAARAARVQRWLDARPAIVQDQSLYVGLSARSVRMKVQAKYGVQPDGTGFGEAGSSGLHKLTTRSGLVDWVQPQATNSYGVCTRPMRDMQVRWTGKSVLCCQDYNGTDVHGDLRTQTLVQMWNAASLHARRAQLQDGIRTGPLCGPCDWNGGAYKHMITRVDTPL